MKITVEHSTSLTEEQYILLTKINDLVEEFELKDEKTEIKSYTKEK